ncbi:MAG: hypothetical protein HPY83_15745 [Anaerolineae bacterium]|nr:hypothetical protein [Anaerolineae bacterium]
MYSEGLPVVTELGHRWGATPSLVLLPGRLYYVAVLGREGDRALVSLGGHRFTAQVVGEIPEQGRIAVTVLEASRERVVLERAPEPPSLPARAGSDDPVVGLLSRMGLPPRPEYQEILPHLIRLGQPLTPENLLSLHEAWGRLASRNPEALPLLARIQAEGLPLVPEALEAASKLAPTQSLLTASTLLRLTQSLVALARALESQPAPRGLDSLPAFARALARSLASLPLASAGHPAVARQVSSLLNRLATPIEAMLARLGPAPSPSPGLQAAQDPISTSDQWEGLPQLSPGNSDLSPEVLIRNPGSDRPRLPALEDSIQVQIRRLDAALDRLMEQPDRFSAESRQALLHCKEAVQSVIADLEAEQIGNLRLSPDHGVSHCLSFSLPIAWSGTQDRASLRVYYRPKGARALDPTNAHLAFLLSVEPLGTVEVDLRLLRRNVSCDVRTEDQETKRLAEEAAPYLRQGLQGLGYLVSSIRCSAAPKCSPEAREPMEPLSLARVNLVDLVG